MVKSPIIRRTIRLACNVSKQMALQQGDSPMAKTSSHAKEPFEGDRGDEEAHQGTCQTHDQNNPILLVVENTKHEGSFSTVGRKMPSTFLRCKL